MRARSLLGLAWFVVFSLAACSGEPGSDDAALGRDASVRRDSGGTLDAGPPAPPGPRFVGRHTAVGDVVRFSWSNAGFIVHFEGTALHANLDSVAQYFTVVLDGVEQPVLHVTGDAHRYDIVTGLANGEHTVEVYRRTEGNFGVSEVRAIEVDGTMLSVPLPTRQIEVVGDSITCGYGAEGPNAGCGFTAETESAYVTYAALAARELDAELSIVAWSGKGVIFNYGTDTNEPMPTLYDRRLAGEADSQGPIDAVDVVVINLGTNDFSTGDDPSEGAFTTAYVDLLRAVRTQHPDAQILCGVAPLLSGDDDARARQYIASAVAMRTSAGDDAVRVADLGSSALIDDLGCDYHPGVRTHAAMAAQMVTAVRAATGW